MTLKQLEALYWVSRLGSFTAAAERLHSTQSAISMRIRDLEETLGVELFDRTVRSARLTAKGQELVGYAERLLALTAEIHARVSDPKVISGVVRVGVAEYVALTWLPDLVRELNVRYPRVTLELSVDLTLSQLDKLRGGEIDLALVPGPVEQPGVRNVPLGRVEFAWMASPSLRIPAQRLTPSDLDNWPILTLSKASNLFLKLDRWFGESGAVGRRANMCNSLSVLATWTIAGLGISYLPVRHFAEDVAAGRLRMLDVAPTLPDLEYFAALDRREPQLLALAVADVAAKVSTFRRATDEPDAPAPPRTRKPASADGAGPDGSRRARRSGTSRDGGSPS